jgi:hypothetical protein
MFDLYLELCANHICSLTNTRFYFILTALSNSLTMFNFTFARIAMEVDATSRPLSSANVSSIPYK